MDAKAVLGADMATTGSQPAQQDAAHVGSVARGLSDRTGRGFDNLGPSDIRSLPLPARAELVALYHEVERIGQWPWQLLVNLTCLKSKPTSGDRGITLMP